MSSLTEDLGASVYSFFVPANVIKAQAENTAMLATRAERLNSNIPDTLAIATRTGVLDNGKAKQSLQDMNRALFLLNDSERQLGEETAAIIKDSAAKAPGVLADAVHGGLNTIGGTIWRAIPWWIWAAVALYVALQAAMIIKALRSSSA